ncbi:MAG: response regulator [Chloroflexi bacterium]|nr:response regulator [Chloroflexota bacterium]MCC6894876.1 response regulator [Anaerolineae bacterium]
MNNQPLQILIVEDEPDGQELVSRMLAQFNVQVDIAGDAEEAWSLLMEKNYAAAIIDLALPERDGFELVSAIRGESALTELPCVAMTAFHTPELKQRAISDGFNAYFPKPLDRSRFLGELGRMMVD